MLVKDIVKNVSQILNLNDVLEVLNNENSNPDIQVMEEIDVLVLAVNLINNNIASNYIELVGKCVLNNDSEILPFNKISNQSIIEIKKVFINNKLVDFKVLPEGVKVPRGNIEILYTYFPVSVDLEDEINYYTKINELVFAQGVVGEYLFLKGAIDDAYMWDKKFKQSLINLLRPKRKCMLPARRWY